MRLRSPADARCASPQALARHNVLSAPLMVFPTLRAAMGESLADEDEFDWNADDDEDTDD